MLLRLRSPAGNDRIEVEPAMTVPQLYSMVASKVSVDSDSLMLEMDNGRGRPSGTVISGQGTLQSLGLAHGSMVHVKDCDTDMKDAEAESRAASMDAGEYAKRKKREQEDQEKIRDSWFGARAGWSGNTVTFKKVDRLRVIKAQKERVCTQAQVTSAAIKILVNAVVSRGFTEHRCAFLYGTYKRRKQEVAIIKWNGVAAQDVVVPTFKMRMETMWEPPQQGDFEGAVPAPDDDPAVKRADAVAAMLGLRRVGFITTVPVQNARDGDVVLRARDLALASKMQAVHGDAFTTLIVPVGQDEQGNTFSCCEAWQATEAMAQLARQEDLAEEQPEDEILKFNLPVTVYKDQADGSAKETEAVSVEVEMFQKKVPIQSHCTRFMRPSSFHGGRANIGAWMRLNSEQPMHRRLADFNLLMALADEMDMKTDMARLCRCVVSGTEVEEGDQLVIDTIAQSAGHSLN